MTQVHGNRLGGYWVVQVDPEIAVS